MEEPINLREELVFNTELKAKIIVHLNHLNSIKYPLRNNLTTGLKRDHPRNVSILYPIMYAIRILIFALSVTFMAASSRASIAVLLLVSHTLVMMSYLTHE